MAFHKYFYKIRLCRDALYVLEDFGFERAFTIHMGKLWRAELLANSRKKNTRLLRKRKTTSFQLFASDYFAYYFVVEVDIRRIFLRISQAQYQAFAINPLKKRMLLMGKVCHRKRWPKDGYVALSLEMSI